MHPEVVGEGEHQAPDAANSKSGPCSGSLWGKWGLTPSTKRKLNVLAVVLLRERGRSHFPRQTPATGAAPLTPFIPQESRRTAVDLEPSFHF